MPDTPPTAARGTVYLVGAGPGDPDLLTVRAARLIGAADVIVHDGLVSEAILQLGAPSARRISVAKQRSRHAMPQAAINALLITLARAGHVVVRLKGGDPFIFGRGGEEVDDLVAADVPVEVVPGISAAIGGAASMLLPLTHRDHASAVSFVAGQCKGLSDQDWSGLAGPSRTLVIYMGVATAADIADKLIDDGVSPAMPVAVIERATLPGTRVLRAPLAGLGALVEAQRVVSPAIIIVGNVAALGRSTEALTSLATLAEQQA